MTQNKKDNLFKKSMKLDFPGGTVDNPPANGDLSSPYPGRSHATEQLSLCAHNY